MNRIGFALTMCIATVSIASADTTITLDSDAGDYIGQGQSYNYDDSNADIRYSRNYDNGITVTIRNLPGEPSDWWTLNLAAPGNAEIQPGVYEGAIRFPFQAVDQPGLSFSGNGRGCNTLTGSFDVLEVAYDGAGDVTALSATFEQHCEDATPALNGSIVFNTVPPVGAKAIGQTLTRVVCRNRTTGQRIVTTSIDSAIVDCKKLGLDVRPGDSIQLNMRGVAEQ
ncbi:MAG: hypothetical protein ACR2Q3_00630 [Woeseiaceae bacterium]